MKILLIYLFCLFIIFPVRLSGQTEFPVLLPRPQMITFHPDHFYIGRIRLCAPVLQAECEMLLKEVGGIPDAQAASQIEIRLTSRLENVKNNPEEAYRISITSQKNGNELFPPLWTNTHTCPSTEIALGNENCTARPPLLVRLRKGWNKVFLKLPVGKFSTPEIRLQKWMFTVIFVTPDGQKATENLIYSPDKIKPKNERL